MPPSMGLLLERLTNRKSESEEVVQKRMRENLVQLEKIKSLRGSHIRFVTNYQYQLTVYGIERLLEI
jgi:guanylate kinase